MFTLPLVSEKPAGTGLVSYYHCCRRTRVRSAGMGAKFAGVPARSFITYRMQ